LRALNDSEMKAGRGGKWYRGDFTERNGAIRAAHNQGEELMGPLVIGKGKLRAVP